MNIKTLSILIPTYNDRCLQLVDGLRQQAEAAGLVYEILVADDGSTDESIIHENSKISEWSKCQYIRRTENCGRSAIRNFLAHKAQYEFLLFIDSDMTLLQADYIKRYMEAPDNSLVIDGGVTIGGDGEKLKTNLRYLYEKSSEKDFTVDRRQKNPYHDFHTANFLVQRNVMLSHPFDERFRCYGYEDVLFGKHLHKDHIPITHIDNPVGFYTFESNPAFLKKTEEGLRTLHQFRVELRGYSRLLTFIDGIHIPLVITIFRILHRIFGKLIRQNLCGNNPSLRLFKLYKLGYFLCLEKTNNQSNSVKK